MKQSIDFIEWWNYVPLDLLLDTSINHYQTHHIGDISLSINIDDIFEAGNIAGFHIISEVGGIKIFRFLAIRNEIGLWSGGVLILIKVKKKNQTFTILV